MPDESFGEAVWGESLWSEVSPEVPLQQQDISGRLREFIRQNAGTLLISPSRPQFIRPVQFFQDVPKFLTSRRDLEETLIQLEAHGPISSPAFSPPPPARTSVTQSRTLNQRAFKQRPGRTPRIFRRLL